MEIRAPLRARARVYRSRCRTCSAMRRTSLRRARPARTRPPARRRAPLRKKYRLKISSRARIASIRKRRGANATIHRDRLRSRPQRAAAASACANADLRRSLLTASLDCEARQGGELHSRHHCARACGKGERRAFVLGGRGGCGASDPERAWAAAIRSWPSAPRAGMEKFARRFAAFHRLGRHRQPDRYGRQLVRRRDGPKLQDRRFRRSGAPGQRFLSALKRIGNLIITGPTGTQRQRSDRAAGGIRKAGCNQCGKRSVFQRVNPFHCSILIFAMAAILPSPDGDSTLVFLAVHVNGQLVALEARREIVNLHRFHSARRIPSPAIHDRANILHVVHVHRDRCPSRAHAMRKAPGQLVKSSWKRAFGP